MTIHIGSGLIYTIVIGFLVGLVARFFYPGRDPMGFIFTTLLGIGIASANPPGLSARYSVPSSSCCW